MFGGPPNLFYRQKIILSTGGFEKHEMMGKTAGFLQKSLQFFAAISRNGIALRRRLPVGLPLS